MVTGTYPPARCGVGDYAGMLSNALAALGVEVYVLTSAYLGTDRRSDGPTVLPDVKSWSLFAAPRVLRQILQLRPDIIHFQLPTTEYGPRSPVDLLVPLSRLRGRPARVVLTLHEPLRRSPLPGAFRPYRFWMPGCCADAIVVVAKSYKDVLHAARTPTRHTPCKVIPNASSIPVSTLGSEELRELRRQTGIADGHLVLSFFGFIRPDKGFEQVLDVLKILRGRGIAANLIVLGEVSNGGPYQRELQRRIERDGLQPHVKALGFLPPGAVADHLKMSDACILPFLDGVHAKSTSFLAAVGQGVLTVTTSTEQKGYCEAENVFYARPGDTDAMAAAVQQHAGLKTPAEVFQPRTWNQVAREHLEFFAEVLGSLSTGATRFPDRSASRPTADHTAADRKREKVMLTSGFAGREVESLIDDSAFRETHCSARWFETSC